MEELREALRKYFKEGDLKDLRNISENVKKICSECGYFAISITEYNSLNNGNTIIRMIIECKDAKWITVEWDKITGYFIK